MIKYIMTFEDGEHYVAEEITDNDLNAMQDGILTIIRCSDQKELQPDLTWLELTKWDTIK